MKEKRRQLLELRKKNKTKGEQPKTPFHFNGRIFLYSVVCFFAVIGVFSTFLVIYRWIADRLNVTVKVMTPPEVTEMLLTPNPYSRPGKPLSGVKGIVVHYTSNPGTTAEQNRNYFEGLAASHVTYASSHYIIGIDGEIIRCIPDDEVAYASNDRNSDTLAIECCHPDEDGAFSEETYASLIWLTAYLVGAYDLAPEDVIRHYDVSGKNCPKYYVEHPESWTKFQEDMCLYIEENGEEVRRSDEGKAD